MGAFGIVWLPYETRCKTGRTSAKGRSMKSHQNCSQRTHPIHPLDPKLTFWGVLYYLGAFGTVWLPYETRCKTGRTIANVRAMKSRQKFLQRTHRSTPLNPKLTFWCISYYLGAFGTVWLPYETRCKTAELPQKYPKQTFWCVLYYLCAFVTIWLAYETRCKTGRSSAKVCATKSCQNFP